MASTLPIAVLDSGAGGLSVVRAIKKLMPHEDIQYFADTAHLPYGIKSPDLIKHLAIKMANRLIKLSSSKVLVVACHTISVWCLKEIEQAVGVPVIGMVEPSINGLKSLLAAKHLSSVGVLSTKATVNAKAYRNAWPSIAVNGDVELIEHACGHLVGLVEDADINESDIATMLPYLLPPAIKNCDGLLIGCTHFSMLISAFRNVLKPTCQIVDGADLAALAAYNYLQAASLLSKSSSEGQLIVYVSDNPERFKIIARRFIEDGFIIEWLRDYARS